MFVQYGLNSVRVNKKTFLTFWNEHLVFCFLTSLLFLKMLYNNLWKFCTQQAAYFMICKESKENEDSIKRFKINASIFIIKTTYILHKLWFNSRLVNCDRKNKGLKITNPKKFSIYIDDLWSIYRVKYHGNVRTLEVFLLAFYTCK